MSNEKKVVAIEKGMFGVVAKDNKVKWCNAYLSDTPIKLSSRADLNACLQAVQVKHNGLGTMVLLGNVDKGKIKSLTIKRESNVAGSRRAIIVDIEVVGKLDESLSAGKLSK